MSGPQVSIVIAAGVEPQRLGLTLTSAVAAGEACELVFEVVVALADADPPTREVAQALDHPRLRLSPGSAASTRAAAELAWGQAVILLRGGDLLSPSYASRLLRMLAGACEADIVARPEAVVTYGGSPAIQSQTSLHGGARDRGRLLFAAPFAPPLAAARSLLMRLPPREWSVAADWSWTIQTLSGDVRHEVAPSSTYVAWSAPVAATLSLPSMVEPAALAGAATSLVEAASEAEVAALLYARAALARTDRLEASARSGDQRLMAMEDEAARLRAALAAAESEADHARRTVEALQASTSWKATAPIRALITLLKPGGAG